MICFEYKLIKKVFTFYLIYLIFTTTYNMQYLSMDKTILKLSKTYLYLYTFTTRIKITFKVVRNVILFPQGFN